MSGLPVWGSMVGVGPRRPGRDSRSREPRVAAPGARHPAKAGGSELRVLTDRRTGERHLSPSPALGPPKLSASSSFWKGTGAVVGGGGAPAVGGAGAGTPIGDRS